MPAKLKVYWHCSSCWSNSVPITFPTVYSWPFEICPTSLFLRTLPEICGMGTQTAIPFTKHKWGQSKPVTAWKAYHQWTLQSLICWVRNNSNSQPREKLTAMAKTPNWNENLNFKFRLSRKRTRSQRESQAVIHPLLGKNKMPKGVFQVCFSNVHF